SSAVSFCSLFFFFSSRRRHTRFSRDWSSDVCSSDLPECSIDELMEVIPAPDFPTGGIIYGMSGVREGYRTGRGRVVMRATTHFEDIDRGSRQAIVVDALPY